MPDDTRDRVIALEKDVQHLSEIIDDMSRKLDEMHEAFVKAKGGWLAIVGLSALAGGLMSWILKSLHLFER